MPSYRGDILTAFWLLRFVLSRSFLWTTERAGRVAGSARMEQPKCAALLEHGGTHTYV
jgi:hypothetical protein